MRLQASPEGKRCRLSVARSPLATARSSHSSQNGASRYATASSAMSASTPRRLAATPPCFPKPGLVDAGEIFAHWRKPPGRLTGQRRSGTNHLPKRIEGVRFPASKRPARLLRSPPEGSTSLNRLQSDHVSHRWQYTS